MRRVIVAAMTVAVAGVMACQAVGPGERLVEQRLLNPAPGRVLVLKPTQLPARTNGNGRRPFKKPDYFANPQPSSSVLSIVVEGISDGTATPTPTPTPTGTGGTGGTGGNLPPGFNLGFDVEPAGTWSLRNSLHRARAGLGAAVLGGKLYAIEGDHRPSFEVLDGAGWTLTANYESDSFVPRGLTPPRLMHQGRMLFATGAGPDAVYTAGGFRGDYDADGGSSLDEVNTYGPGGYTGAGALGTDAAPIRVRACAGGVIGGYMYAAGGTRDNISVTGATVRYALATGLSESRAAMPVAVAGAASVVSGGKLYVIGGYTLDGSGQALPQTVVQAYDPAADTWRRDGQAGGPAALPVAVHSAAAAVLGDKIYLAGGIGADGVIAKTLRVYDLAAKTWSTGPDMPTARCLHALAPYNGAVLAIGGIGRSGGVLRTVEAYQP